MDFGPEQGTVSVRTGVAGSAARMGHRLVLSVNEWSAQVDVEAGEPTSLIFRASLSSLKVESGSGGVTTLTIVDKQVIQRNASKSLDVGEYPEAVFDCHHIVMTEGTIDVAGDLTIHGVTEAIDTTLTIVDGRAQGSVAVVQSDFGIKPYSAMLGQLKVSDEVTVELDIALPEGSPD